MTREQLETIHDQALVLSQHIAADIANASSRIEHIRLTQLATEAEALVAAVEILLTPEPIFTPTHI